MLSLAVNLTTKIVETKNEFRSDAISEAVFIGDYCVMPIEFNYPERAKEVLQVHANKSNINCASVYTQNGEIFSAVCKGKQDIPGEVEVKKLSVQFSGNELSIIQPILHNGKNYGAIFINYYTGLKATIIKQLFTALLILAIIVLLSFVLALHFQRYISMPILRLAHKASEISKDQNYKTKIEKTSNDEIGLLYDRFNHMLMAINTREQERDDATMALIRSEEKFRNIFNFSLDGILVTTMDGTILEASKMAGDIFELPANEVFGKNVSELMPEAYLRQRVSILRNLEAKGEYTFVTRYTNKLGKKLHLEFSSKIINHDGNKSILSLIRDISKRVKADEALRESEERYKKLVENFPSAIALHRDGKIVFVNDGIKSTLMGSAKKDFIGMDFMSLVPDSNKDAINTYFQSTLDSNTTSPAIEVKLKKLSGEIIDVELSSIPLFFGKQKTLLTVFKDISSRKQIEEELVVALKQAEESDKLKSSFLANMSHEIRTPMNGIIGFADLLNKENIDKSDIRRYVDIIKSSADRLLNIINDIIDISKIEAGVINLTIETFDLEKLIVDIYQFFLPQAERKGIVFNLNRSNKRHILNTDKSKLSQILTNLVSNALKFTSEGFIEMGYRIDDLDNSIELYVKDTGIGIPKEQLKSIFERFRQADHYLHDFKEGTGLGLSICKGFTDALGGTIWVESEVEKGSTFYFEIPMEVKQIMPVKLPEPTQIKQVKQLKDRNILIVEDEENNYLYLKELLESQGANIYWADDGLKSIQMVLDHPEIDFVLMDIKLPVMDGLTAAKKIKDYRNTLPIVAQTAFGLEGDKERTIASGLDDYLAKPILRDELFSVIDKYISTRS
jgi:PAS domain S-box-containing protein